MVESVAGQPEQDYLTQAPWPGSTNGQPGGELRWQEPVPDDDGREIIAGDLAEEDKWVFLIDPGWQAAEENEDPPPEAVVGGWFVEADGTTGYFRPNPDYEPSAPDMPTDPVDAVLQLVVHGDAGSSELLDATKDIILGVAVDEEGMVVVAPAPDDVPSVLATTAPRHRARVNVPDWREVTIEELAGALPDEGVDVLLNPGAPASMRLLAEVVKDFVGIHGTTSADDAEETNDETAETPVAEAAAVAVVSEAAAR